METPQTPSAAMPPSFETEVRHSIRTKLIVVVSMLVVVLMSVTAWILMTQKKDELTRDIYTNTRTFAELTADDIVTAYEGFLQESAFIQFNRVIQGMLRKSEDISRITLVRFNGEVLYDSETEVLEAYEASFEERSIATDKMLLERVQAPFPSLNVLKDGRTVYLEKDKNGLYAEVNLNGKKIEALRDNDRVGTIVYPLDQKYAVLYQVTYRLLDWRMAKTYERIGLLILAGISLGVVIAIAIGARIASPIRLLTAGASEIAKGNFDHRVDVRSKDELGVLSGAFNQMAGDLKKSTQALVYKERVMKELEIAKSIQQSLIPAKIPLIEGLDIMASVDPAEEIGGDCYDFIQVDTDRTIMYQGDVTGHGVASGLLVSVANAVIFAFSEKCDIFDVMVRTNAILKAKSKPNMFITMAMLDWNSTDKGMNFISAGHEKILHYRAKSKEVIELPSGGLALGMLPDCSKLLKKLPIQTEVGDFLIIYSDGIPEAWSPKREQYGLQRLRKIILDTLLHCADVSKVVSKEVHDNIIKDVNAFMADEKQADDITLMVIRRTS